MRPCTNPWLIALAALAWPGAASVAAPNAIVQPPGTQVRARGDGWVLVDERGMTLYTTDRDEGTPGRSSCDAACATIWPPLAAPADAKPVAGWSTVPREDGSLQWAYRGKPLYLYSLDPSRGSSFGDGVDSVWRTAFRPIPLPREVRIGATVLGNVLTDSKGLTLYASGADSPGKAPKCTGRCLQGWRPVNAPWTAQAFGDWTIVTRDDGTPQWAFKGKPLYRHPAGDVSPGEVRGQEIEGWQAIVLEPAPQLPGWATIQGSDAGELIATQKGLTVYTHSVFRRGQRRLQIPQPADCPEGGCIDSQWIPFIAAPDAKAMGSWALVKLPDGRQQWTYKGQKLYTHALDEKPGDFRGIRFGGDRAFSAIMRSGEPMQGVTVGG